MEVLFAPKPPARPVQTASVGLSALNVIALLNINRFARSSRLKGVGGIIFSVALASAAVFALTRALHNVDYDQVFAIIRQIETSVIGVATLLMFRFLYHFIPMVVALALFGTVEGWRSLRAGADAPPRTEMSDR